MRSAAPRIRRIALLGAVLGAVAAATPASATQILATPGGIVVTDTSTRANDLRIGFPAAQTIRVRDAAGPVTIHPSLTGPTGVACRAAGPATVVCTATRATPGLRLRIDTGRGDDRVTFLRTSTSAGLRAPVVAGGAGSDTITGDGLLMGGDGDDILRITTGTVTAALMGGRGDDVLIGSGAGDVLVGGPGDDRMIDRFGANLFRGGAGRDEAVIGRSPRLSSASIDEGGQRVGAAPTADTIYDDVEVVRSA